MSVCFDNVDIEFDKTDQAVDFYCRLTVFILQTSAFVYIQDAAVLILLLS